MEETEIKWRGLVLVPTKAATDELYRLNMSIRDVKNILENGYGCSESRRSAGKYELCLDTGERTAKVVVAKGDNFFRYSEVWIIIHVGVYPRRHKHRSKGYLEGFGEKERGAL
ncbi:MAG: hypothetical protein V1813_02645 [Candidatus Aenigmatarchaeota archaeon]